MHYSRAGLVALIFALIISLVSAVPIPAATESKLSSTLSPPSNPIPNGQDLIQLDTAKTSGISLSGRMSTLPLATKLSRRVMLLPYHLLASVFLPFIHQQIPDDMEVELVRRTSIGTKIKNAFQACLDLFSLNIRSN